MEVIGRHALLFDDDTMAAFVNSEDALVEWHSLKIDRYDVRHLLSAPPPPRRRNRSYEPKASDDPAVDFLIEQERYLDLPLESDQPGLGAWRALKLNENVITNYFARLISWKRAPEGSPRANLRTLKLFLYPALEGEEGEKPSSSGGYRAVAFSYGNTGDSADQENTDVGMEARGFLPPFSVPGDIVQSLPPTEKIHQIIARTAIFVSKHGGQTEIILRVKQGDNPTFGFLMPDHHLHAYFRYLVEHPELLHTEIDEKFQDERKTAGSENNKSGNVGGALSLLGSAYGSGEEEDGDDAFNASLSHDAKSTESMETAAKGESLSRKLILCNKGKVPAVKKNSSIISSKPKSVKGIKKEDAAALISAKEEKLRNRGIGTTSKPVIEPPQELKRLIDKLVEFVMRNGRQFEATLLEQDSKLERFPFLLSSHQYHSYYLKALEAAQESKVNGKILYPGQDDQGGRGNSKKASVVKDEFCDVPFDSDRKEKFKMVIGKSKKEAQETEKESQESGFTVDAVAAAAILQAATKGIKSSGLRFTSTAPNSHDNAVQKEDATSNTNMTEEQKLKAERLKRAKMFVAMLKSGALPSRTGTSRGSSAEPVEPGLLKSAAEASSASHEREGSLAPAVVEKSAYDGNFIERQSERQSKRKYRSRSIGIEDDEEDSHREGHSDRKHRSRSRNSEDDEDENERKFYQEKGRHPSHSGEENKNEVESSEENICREERDDKGNEKYSERIYNSRTRSHKEDDEVGKDRKHRRKRRRSRSTSEESESREESDGQDTEHKHHKSEHRARHPQRDKNDGEGTYKVERAKEHSSYKSRSRRHEGSGKTENAVEEDKHYRRKHSSHSSYEESEDESDHRHSKSSRSKHKNDHRKDIHKEERDHKRSKKSRHSHHSSSESPSRRRKHRSSHTSHHSRDRHSRHRNAHSSKDKEFHQHHHKHDSSSDDEHRHRTAKESHDPRVELEEGEISHKDESLATVSGDGQRGTSVDIITSSETTEVPADLRAKIRAMLMSTRS